jgi:fatty-acyl-CoA synthase
MNGLIMDYQLTLPAIQRRSATHFGDREVISRLPCKTYHRYTYAQMSERANRLSVALRKLGVGSGDRVGTLSWNHYWHLEAYFGIPAAEAVLHTLNLRLHPDDLAYIASHADDKVILVDDILLPLLDQFRDRIKTKHIVVIPTAGAKAPPKGMLDYEALLADANPRDFREPVLDERQAAAMCYTSGTTGKPKGVLYTHRALCLHSMAGAMTDMLGICEADIVVPVVPMFHANAWALPYVAAMTGARLAFPGPALDPVSLVEMFQEVKATVSAGVPTIWMGILQTLDKDPKKYDLSAIRQLIVGGSAAPKSMIHGFWERHHLQVVQAWGMTELSPMGTVARPNSVAAAMEPQQRYAYLAKQGSPAPFIEIRGRGENGFIEWDGKQTGELECRGPWVASEYYEHPEPVDSFTEDGWFRTGDIVSIDPAGTIEIQDRAKDVIKSGGEWISSVQLENLLMGHESVAEAAVVAIPDAKWQERPLACVVRKAGSSCCERDLLDYLSEHVAKWWIPDAVVFVEAIPRTSAGKFQKSALRDRFKEFRPETSPQRQ